MSGRDLFGRILESLNAGVFDDAQWAATSGLVDEFCGAKGNHLVLGDGAAPGRIDIFFAWFCYRGERRADLEREYFEFYQGADERLLRIKRLADGQLAPVRELFSEEEKKTSALYNELMVRTEAQGGLNARLAGPGGSCIVWSFADPVAAEGWSSAQVERIGSLLPHVRHFVRVRQALAGANALGASLTGLLDHVGTGRHPARPAGAGDGGQRPRPGPPARGCGAHRPGRRAARRPARRGRGAPGVARPRPALCRRSGRRRLDDGAARAIGIAARAACEPCSAKAGRRRARRRPARWCSRSSRRRGPASTGSAWASLLGLTPRESHLALALAEGRTVQDVARETGRSVNTVRWHLQHIYTKLGLSRQAEVVRVVTALADVPGVRR